MCSLPTKVCMQVRPKRQLQDRSVQHQQKRACQLPLPAFTQPIKSALLYKTFEKDRVFPNSSVFKRETLTFARHSFTIFHLSSSDLWRKYLLFRSEIMSTHLSDILKKPHPATSSSKEPSSVTAATHRYIEH